MRNSQAVPEPLGWNMKFVSSMFVSPMKVLYIMDNATNNHAADFYVISAI